MDDVDRTLEYLKIHIKKEIVDNYFADRVYLEEDAALLQDEAQAYRADFDLLRRRWFAFYQALGSEPAIAAVMAALSLPDWPAYEPFRQLTEAVRQDLLKDVRRRGFTARRRFRYLILALYEELQKETVKLRERYDAIATHLKLINEDIDKFNLSYDFGLIAAQMEALEGRQEVFSGELFSPDREELSTRMRLKRQKLTDEELPPLPELPPLTEIKPRLAEVLDRVYQP
jgi:hypothetical protein